MRVLCASRINLFEDHKDGILADSPAEQDGLTLRRRVHGARFGQKSRAIFEMRNCADLFPSRRLCFIVRARFTGLARSRKPIGLTSFTWTLGYVLIMWLMLWFLYRNKLFWRRQAASLINLMYASTL